MPVLVLTLLFAAALATRPVLRRLAIRNAVRRPRESLLVVLGAALGTAMFTAAFVVGHSFETSLRDLAAARLGPIDEVVVTDDRAVAARVAERLAVLDDELVDGQLALLLAESAVDAGSDSSAIVPRVQVVEVDIDRAREFGDDVDSSGLRGVRAEPDTAVLVDEVARLLDVGVGDTVRVLVAGEPRELRVGAIVAARGIAGLGLEIEAATRNIIVPPGTLAAEGARHVFAISNEGDAEGGADLSAAVMALLDDHLEGLPVGRLAAKQAVLDTAEKESTVMSQQFQNGAIFGVAAGLLLLSSIVLMLAEERSRELAVMRAVGMRRRTLVAVFALEGWCYCAAAAVVGAVLGMGFARVAIGVLGRYFDEGVGSGSVRVVYDAAPQPVVLGLTVGLAVSLATVVATGAHVARRNIVGAIRGETSHATPVRTRARAWVAVGLVVSAVAAVVGIVSIAATEPWGVLLAPAVAIVALEPALATRFSRRTAMSVVSGAAMVWTAAAVPLINDAGVIPDAQIFGVQGLVLTSLAVVLVSFWQVELGALVQRVRPSSAAARIAFSSPAAHPVRTGVMIGTFALVSFTVAFAVIAAEEFGSQDALGTEYARGGFDALLRSSTAAPLPEGVFDTDARVVAAAPLATQPVRVSGGRTRDAARRLSSFDERLIDGGAPRLRDRGRYATDEAAYRAVVSDPDLVIVTSTLLQPLVPRTSDQLEVGDQLVIENPTTGERRTVTIAALRHWDYLRLGVFYGSDGAQDFFGPSLVPNVHFLAAADGDVGSLVADLPVELRAHGVEVERISDAIDRMNGVWSMFVRALQATQATALVTGIAGLAVVMARSVRDRRREFGMLRSVGLRARTARLAVLLEAGFVALLGVGVGTVLAVIVSIDANSAIADGFPWVLPVVPLAVVIGGTVTAAIIAALLPAYSASRLTPAATLRVID
ncbi:MAG: FtsX-like permease family protein [Actinomycetota bacterium]